MFIIRLRQDLSKWNLKGMEGAMDYIVEYLNSYSTNKIIIDKKIIALKWGSGKGSAKGPLGAKREGSVDLRIQVATIIVLENEI